MLREGKRVITLKVEAWRTPKARQMATVQRADEEPTFEKALAAAEIELCLPAAAQQYHPSAALDKIVTLG